MSTLRTVFERLGYSDVTTYIQSGNVVFDSPERRSTALAPRIEVALANEFGLAIGVVVRSARELNTVIETNPFLGRVKDPSKLHVLFLDAAPDPQRLETIDAARFVPDQYAVGAREIYLHCPNGVGRSKLAAALGPKLAPLSATMRNWNTTTKLAEFAAR